MGVVDGGAEEAGVGADVPGDHVAEGGDGDVGCHLACSVVGGGLVSGKVVYVCNGTYKHTGGKPHHLMKKKT